MNKNKEWKIFGDMIDQYKDNEYTDFSFTKISKIKEKWVGGVFHNGRIYGIINSERRVICIDPSTRTYELFGHTHIGTFKWTGGCYYKGLIYGYPRKENSLLIIDPVLKKVYEKELGTTYRGEHHYSGICTDDGIVYQPPRNTDHILKIDLNQLKVHKIRITEYGIKCRYSSAIQIPDGTIYFIPEPGRKVLRLSPKSEEIDTIGTPFEAMVFGVVLGYDGNIYGFCKDGEGILKIDAKKSRVEWICNDIGCPNCYGSIVGINGKIIGIPAGSKQIWQFDIESQRAEILFELAETGIAKCAGAGIGNDGTICMIPAFGELIYFLGLDRPLKRKENMSNCYFNTDY